MKKLFQLLFHRIIIIILLMIIQILLLVGMIWRFNQYFVYFYAICYVIGTILLLQIINSSNNPEYKLAWIIPLLLVPIFGGLFYLLFGLNRVKKSDKERYIRIREKQIAAVYGGGTARVLEEIDKKSPAAANQVRYIENCCKMPAFDCTASEYLSLGELMFSRLKEELEKAERYIFMEYFIIEEGVMWDSILEILARKAKEGLDVRVMYDDLGCMFTLPYKYDKKLESLGIKCVVFSPFVPVLSSRFNNRDHRKIVSIDGKVCFTGGINLADEYINARDKHGHWKDTAILLRGDAAWGFTVMFLTMWDFTRGEERDYTYYRPEGIGEPVPGEQGYVQPYLDIPLDHIATGENVYLNMIYKAEKYIYITSPYLVIDNELITALSAAAQSGVDVRIITPHIGDKWYVHAVTRAYYGPLLENNVRIYEYIPGFIHAKSFVADDSCGVVGTVNLDFRSLYLHYECGAWLYGTSSIAEIRDDFLATLEKCWEVSLNEHRNISWYRKMGRAILRLFAPLM
ncbi:cardiolipin synthase [Breznakiella homolactica]|uniref:Cardiolipin synthase n=1 Tax=Breznakiella homolactica TaxID=2798577 RepID=A0A7T7XRK7_9SPIR|nr:cardiolipin synthase [Breznakiella homolactica]QQO11200.1 cardiolipin synthase [Breznakiella homolactica]